MESRDFFTLVLFTLVGFLFISPANSQLQEINKNEMGLEVYFKIVHTFLGDILQPKNISESFINLTTVFVDGNFDSDVLTDWQEWANYLIGYSVCVAIGMLFFVLMPIAGLIFCCCRCCGKCGGAKRHIETNRSKCKRNTCCTFLVVFNTLALAGVICAFMCNTLLYEHLKNDKSDGMVGHMQNSLQHIQVFANSSVQNVSDKALQTVRDVSDKVIIEINDTGNKSVEDALDMINATAHLQKAKSISESVNITKDKLQKINSLLGNLTEDTKALQDNLTQIKDDVEKACGQNCNLKENEYKTKIDFSKVGNLSEEAKKVSEVQDMDKFIKQAEESINKAQAKVRNEIQAQTSKVSTSIEDVNKTVNDGIKDLRTKTNEAVGYLSDAYKQLNDADETIKDYADYIYYGGIGVCCAYLLIVVMYYFGILFGLCGERPGDGAPCCNRGAGSKFLMAGVALTFIFSWILMLLCTIMFITGGLSYTEVCRYFVDHDPKDIQIFDTTLNNGLDLSGAIFKNKSALFSVSESLRKCQDDVAVYSAFDLQNLVDLDSITNLDSFDQELKKLDDKNINVDNIIIINDELKESLQKLSAAGLNASLFEPFINETTKNITTVNLRDLADKIESFIPSVSSDAKKETLTANAGKLKELNDYAIPALKANTELLRSYLTELQGDEDSFSASITDLINSLEASQTEFNTKKSEIIKKAIGGLAEKLLNSTNLRVDQLKSEIKTDVGRCQPLSDAFFSLTDSACVLAVDPVNGLWFAFGGCLFFFVLCLICAVPLISLYRCEHKYEKEFDDPNYVMYGGPNPDTIPLTSMERLRAQHHSQGYPHHSGLSNSAYSPDAKHTSAPPPYRDDRHPGIAAYAYPPPEYNGHQHHDLASAYPALHKSSDRHQYQHHPQQHHHSYHDYQGHEDSYNYPY